MGSSYGRTIIGEVGHSVQVIASGYSDVSWKPGGITVDWDVVDTLDDDVTLPGGSTVKAGQKYIPGGTVMCQITSNGEYGPYEDGDGDGRGAMARGKAYLLNEDITQDVVAPGIVQGNPSNHPGVFDGGTVWKGRLKVGHGAPEPSFEDFEAAFPLIKYVSGNLAADSTTLTND